MINLSFRGKKFKIVDRFFIFLAVALVVIIAGVVDIIVQGMNIGLEFSAGATIEVTVNDFAEFDTNDFVKRYENWIAGDRDNDGTVENARRFDVSRNTPISRVAGETTLEFRIGTSAVENGNSINLTDKVTDESSPYYGDNLLVAYTGELKSEMQTSIVDYLQTKYPSAGIENESVKIATHTIDNSVMLYTVRTAFIAAGVAVLVVLAYIMIRFTWVSGIAAVLALIHDVAIMIAFTTFFRIPVNSTFIAAIVTIIGYSINATIVVFDRIRELMRTPSYDAVDDKELANTAITNTLSRSILTTLTTLVVIVLLAIFGNATIREFAFPIIFGLIAGAYSSVFLAASIWVYLRKLFKQSGKRSKKKSLKKQFVRASAPEEKA